MSLLAPKVTLRHPDPSMPNVMRRRGWWLVVLGLLLPGSAQIAAGNRKLGRFGLVTTFIMWGLALLAALLYFVNRGLLLTIVGNSIAMLAIEIVAIIYGIIWLVIGLDTLRLTKLVKIKGAARWGVAVASLIAIIVPVGAAGYVASILDASRGLFDDVFQASGPSQDPIDGHYTFMLLGADSGEDREGLRPDSIAVVTVNAETGAATMIGIPRNLMNVPFPEDSPMAQHWPNGFNCAGSDCMINAAYTYGMNNPDLYPDAEKNGSDPGLEATRDAVEGVTGLTMQYYVVIDMQGFADLVDALGGVTIDVKNRVPIGITGGPVEEWIEPGEQVLDGYHALWYARSRADSSDYDRMERQRQVMEAVIKQFTPQTLLTSYNQLADAGKDFVQTDIPQSMVGYLADLADKTRKLEIEKLELVPPLIVSEDPDFAVIREEVAAAMDRAYQNSLPSESPSDSE